MAGRWLVEFELEPGAELGTLRERLVAAGAAVPEFTPVPMSAGPGGAPTWVLAIETADAECEGRVRRMSGLRTMIADLALYPAKEQ